MNRLVLALVFGMAALTGCSTVVEERPADYRGLDDQAGSFLIITDAGDTWRAARVRVEGEVLHILALDRSDRRWKQVELPIRIPVTEIATLERREPQPWRSVGAAVAVAAGAVGLVWLAWALGH